MTLEEYAGFADLTYHFTERFDIQVGGRQSWIEQRYLQGTDVGKGDASPFTYMFTPRLRLSPELMIYARVAAGYRAGGPNSNIALSGAASQYDPDETVNYEIGIKGSLLDRAVTFDASIYRIDWTDIQFVVRSSSPTTPMPVRRGARGSRCLWRQDLYAA